MVYLQTVDKLNIPERFDEIYRTLPKERREKIDRLKFAKDKYLSMGVWLLLREAVNDADLNEETLSLKFTEKGKPYFENTPLCFSLSHSGEYVMCVTSNDSCGCDVEKTAVVREGLPERVLSKNELAEYNKAGKTEKFYEFWTKKEAIIKALDLGFDVPLNEIDTTEEKYASRLTTKITDNGYVYSIYM